MTANLAVLNVLSLSHKPFNMNELVLDCKSAGKLLTETWFGMEAPVVLTESCPPSFHFYFLSGEVREGVELHLFLKSY